MNAYTNICAKHKLHKRLISSSSICRGRGMGWHFRLTSVQCLQPLFGVRSISRFSWLKKKGAFISMLKLLSLSLFQDRFVSVIKCDTLKCNVWRVINMNYLQDIFCTYTILMTFNPPIILLSVRWIILFLYLTVNAVVCNDLPTIMFQIYFWLSLALFSFSCSCAIYNCNRWIDGKE